MGFNLAFKGLRAKMYLTDLKNQSVPRSKHAVWVIKTYKLTFDILLTVHLNIFMLILTNLMH